MPSSSASPAIHPHLLRRHRRLLTRDLDEARAFIGRAWERHESRLRQGRTYGIRWHQAALPRSSLAYAATPSRLAIDCGAIGDVYHLTLHEAGHLHHSIDGRALTSDPTLGVIHAPGQELRLATEPFRLLLLTFRGAFVREALLPRFDGACHRVLRDPAVPLKGAPGSSLRALVRWLAGELDRPDTPLLGSTKVALGLEKTLRALLLDVLEAASPVLPPNWDTASERHVRRVEAWIEAHHAEPIDADDLARVVGVAKRTLQNAFQRHRGHSPMAAVVHARLRHARRALIAATPGVTVTTVAMDHAFFHLGRFARQYHALFGEKPSETRARASGRGA